MMNIKIWGCRGSLPAPGTDKDIYGGNTSCIEIIDGDTCIILDGGSGLQRLNNYLAPNITRIDILLTHLHLDHIMGLGFFWPLYNPNMTVNIWGPAASNESLAQRLRRYFSPPIFPVRLNELPCKGEIFEIDSSEFQIEILKSHRNMFAIPALRWLTGCKPAILLLPIYRIMNRLWVHLNFLRMQSGQVDLVLPREQIFCFTMRSIAVKSIKHE
ncbi:MAG: MBL fold metallo-hydrolase [Bacteroidetes bacterium]|nr:MBL fold metallo-hydrolase [Bacteroidota bacterium]